jgi:hypothetical protein
MCPFVKDRFLLFDTYYGDRSRDFPKILPWLGSTAGTPAWGETGPHFIRISSDVMM